MELVPSFALFRGLYELAQYASLAQYKVQEAPVAAPMQTS